MYGIKILTVLLLALLGTSLLAQEAGLGRSEGTDPEQINRSLNSQKVKQELEVLRNEKIKEGKISKYSSRISEKARHTTTKFRRTPKVVPQVKVAKKPAPQLSKGGVMASGLFIHLGISAASSIASHVKDGCSVGETAKNTFTDLTRTDFLLGDLLGGTVGAMAGSLIPLPGALSAFPAIGLATIGAQLGHHAVSLLKEDNFTLANLFKAIDIPSIIGQTLGATIGVAAAATILPGTVGAIIGGMAGGFLGLKLLQCFFPKDEEETIQKESSVQKLQISSPADNLQVKGEIQAPNDLIELSNEVKRTYQELLEASKIASPKAPILLEKYRVLQKELQSAWAMQASD